MGSTSRFDIEDGLPEGEGSRDGAEFTRGMVYNAYKLETPAPIIFRFCSPSVVGNRF